ncbi:MAG: hypothetical protein AAF039_12100, partial [Bacteroidota bacterium]
KYLRYRNFNEFLHRLRYKFNNKKKSQVHYSFIEFDDFKVTPSMQAVDIYEPAFSFLKHVCYDFLYLYQENEKDLKVFKVNYPENQYVLEGQKVRTLVQFAQ